MHLQIISLECIKTMDMDADVVKATRLVQDLSSKVADVISHVQNQVAKVEAGEWSTSKGVSFLEVKYHLLLSYLINLTKLLSSKVRGESINGDPAVDRLVEIRTVLEKMRPIDQKLKYQVDKLIRVATTGSSGEGDPLRFKPNPDNLVSKLDEEDDDSGSSSAEDKPDASTKVYRPPKLAAMHYDGDDTMKDRQEKRLERAKSRALSSSIMKDLHAEYYEGPEEIKDNADIHRAKADKAGRERTEYEEKYFVRTAMSKKDKMAAKRVRTMAGLDDLTRFGDISALTQDGPQDMDDRPRKKRKVGSKGKGKKGSKKRKFRRM